MTNEDRNTNPSTYGEPDNPSMALANQGESGQDHQRVRISVHSVRKRLVDPDAISTKAVIDGIVAAGVLKDDSAKEIEGPVIRTQEKGMEEKTIIMIDGLY